MLIEAREKADSSIPMLLSTFVNEANDLQVE